MKLAIAIAVLLGAPALFPAQGFGVFPPGASSGSGGFVYIGALAGIPATCTVGQVAFITDATPGQNQYNCTATNIWTQNLNSGSGGANTALSNLVSVSINTSLLAQTSADLGSTAKPFRNLFLYGAGTYGTNYFEFTGTPSSTRTITIPDATDTVTLLAATQTLTNKSIAGSEINSGVVGSTYGGTGVNNGSSTITIAGNLVTTGAFNTTFAQAGTTTVTLPSTSSTMARTDAGQTFTGTQTFSTPIAAGSGGTGVANTATLTLGSSNINFATFITGIAKITTTTGAFSDAASSDVIGLFSGTCSSSTFLRGDGSCNTPSGGGNVSNTGTPTNGQIAQWTSATVIQGITLGGDCTLSSSTITCTQLNGSNFTVNSSGLATKIDGITTVGTGLPIIGWNSNVTGQSTSQSAVTLATSPTAGFYRINYHADLNTPCTTGANSVAFTFNYTDASNARALTTGPLTLGAAQTTASYLAGLEPIYVGSGNVTYTSTVTGTCATGTSTYDVHVNLERMQ